MDKKMLLETIFITGLEKQSVRIACVQLASPFYRDIEEIRNSQNELVFGVTAKCEERFIKRTNNIHKMLEEIAKSINPDFIVLPEYTFLATDNIILGGNESSIDKCVNISNRYKTIIIGNYYDRVNRRSSSYIAVPEFWAEKTIYFTNKQTVSTYDKGVLKNCNTFTDEEATLLKFVWKEKKSRKSAFFQILTCKDFLYFTSIFPLRKWPHIIDLDMPGIIFSPMSTTVIKPFEDRALSLIRDINQDDGEKTIVSVLCNATSIAEQEDNSICGNSQIICPIDPKREVKPILKRGAEGVVFAEINPFKSITKPTGTSEREANAVMLDSSLFEISYHNNRYLLTELSKSRHHSGLTINPNFLSSIGIRKIYGFLRLDNYTSVKSQSKLRFQTFSNLSISMHGIYGVHDVICYSYEEFYKSSNAKELIRSRIWPMVTDDIYFNNEHFGCCCVENTIKHRGVILEEWKGILYNRSEIQEIKRSLKKFVSHKKIDESHKSYFINNNILIASNYDQSDINEKEINEGKLEFLIILTLFIEDKGPSPHDVHYDFSENVLSILTKDSRIRTIEKISSEGTGFVNGHYLLHIVGDLTDLNNIVIGKLHGLLKNHRCGTRVIIPAERISSNDYPCLEEFSKSTATEPQLLQIIKEWREIESNFDKMMNHIIPPIINMLDEDTREMLLSIYFHADKLSIRHITNNPNWVKNLYKLMYGLSASIAGEKCHLLLNNADISDFCREFILNISTSIEKELIELFERIALKHKISIQSIESAINELSFVIKKARGSLKINKLEIGTAAFILESLNGYCSPDSKYCEQVKKHFFNIYEDTAIADIHLKCIGLICSELFHVRLTDIEYECLDFFKTGDMTKIREVFNSKSVKISSNTKLSPDNSGNFILKDRGEIFIIEDRTDRLHLHYQIITKEMISGINLFVNNARNIMSHTDHNQKLYPQLILKGTYSGLRFLDNIARRIDRKIFPGTSVFSE